MPAGAELFWKKKYRSLDGPDLKLSFLDMNKDNHLTEELPNLIELASCWLHTVYNLFKHGEHTFGWLLKKFLVLLYKIFDQAPGRLTENKNAVNAIDKDFPMQFVSHRWVKNVKTNWLLEKNTGEQTTW